MNSVMQGFWQNAKRNTFTLMYLMSETSVNERSHHVEIALGIGILFLDFFQTLRTAIAPAFGWPVNSTPLFVVRAFDFLDYGVAQLDSTSLKVISVVCIIISTGALINAAYCLWQISTNQLDRIWTFKNLRSTVTVIVTSLFPNFLEFAISPFTCSFWTNVSSTCAPFAFPQVFGTLFVLIVVIGLLFFAISCSLLFQEIDLLTYDPVAVFHGEANAGYLILQCILIFVPVVSNTTSILVPVVLFIAFALLAAYVLRVLPFMFRATNFIKVSMYSVLAWTNFCCILLRSSISADAIVVLFIVGSFVVAIAGFAAVYWRCKQLASTADKMLLSPARATKIELPILDRPLAEVPMSKAFQKLRKVANAVMATTKLTAKVNAVIPAGALTIEFAEVSPVSRYLGEHEESPFFQAIDAVAAAKVLLWRKKRGELVNIKSLLRTSMVQHGKSDSVALFSLCFVYYIEEDIDRVTHMLDSVKDLNLSLTNEFLKFSISRSLIQRYKSTHVGGMVSAIGLLEFTKVQDEASRLHRSCLRTLRSFWRSAGSGQDVSVLSDHLKEFLSCYQTANMIMNDMLLKYPNSVMLLRSYATFLQDISNDTVRSTELFQKAEMLSNMEEEKPDADQHGSRSSGGPTQNQRAHWTTHVMSKDISVMTNVSSYMTWTLLLLLFVCATVFFILDFYFIRSAESLVYNIFELNVARSEAMRSMYFMRSAYLHGVDGDLKSLSKTQEKLLSSSNIVSSYISNQPFTEDVAEFMYFTKQLYYETSGDSINQRSLQCGQVIFLFCDAATKVAQESASNFKEMSTLAADNYLKRNLKFGALNFYDPVVQIFESASLLLEGQVTQFVFLSIVFFVVASIVCVMLGLHMIVLARRLLSDAGVLMRSSTICIVAALNINTSTRKFISKYYMDLDQNFQSALGEDAQTFTASENRNISAKRNEAETSSFSEKVSDAGSVRSDFGAGSDGILEDAGEQLFAPFITEEVVNAPNETNRIQGSMMETFLASSLSNIEPSLMQTVPNLDTKSTQAAIKTSASPLLLDDAALNARHDSNLGLDAWAFVTVESGTQPALQITSRSPIEFAQSALQIASHSPIESFQPALQIASHSPIESFQPALQIASRSPIESSQPALQIVSRSPIESSQSALQIASHSPIAQPALQTAARSPLESDRLPVLTDAAQLPRNNPLKEKEQTSGRTPSKPQSAPPQHSAPQPGRVAFNKVLRQSNKVTPLPSPGQSRPVVNAGNGAIAINQLRKAKNVTSRRSPTIDATAPQLEPTVLHEGQASRDDIVLALAASGVSSAVVDAADSQGGSDVSAADNNNETGRAALNSPKPARIARVAFAEDGSSADGQSEHRQSDHVFTKAVVNVAGGSGSSISSVEGSERRSKKMRILAMLCLFIVGIVAFNLIIINYIRPVAIGSSQYIRIVDMLDLIADLLPPGGYILEPLLNSLLILGLSSSSNTVFLESLKTRYSASRSQFFLTNLRWLSTASTDAMRSAFSDQNVNAKEFFSVVDRDVIAQITDHAAASNGLFSKSSAAFNTHRAAIGAAVELANADFAALSVSGSSLVLSTVNICIGVSVGIFAVCGCIICVETFRVYAVFFLKSCMHNIIPDEQFEAIKEQFAVGGFEWDLNHPRNFRSVIILCICIFVSLIMINMGILGHQANLVLVASAPYAELETTKLLIADILPPPMYLIEMFASLMIGLEMSSRSGETFFGITNSADSWMPKIDTLISDYKTRENFWSSRFSNEFLAEALANDLFPTSQQLISDYRDFVVPLVRAGNISAAKAYTYGSLKDRFLAHRTAVKNLISFSNRELTRTKSSAMYGIKSVGLMVYGSAIAILVVILFLVSILLRQKVSNQLELSNAVSDPSSVVHSLFPKLRQEANRSRHGLSDNAVAVVFSLLVVLQILSIGLPIRYMSSIQQLSPIANQQGRMLSSLYFGSFASRELFIADELTSFFRQTQDLAQLMSFSTSELRSVYQAVRNGADYGIASGRLGSPQILAMFDSPQCLLDTGVCPSSRTFNSARSNGLAVLINSLLDSLGRIPNIAESSMSATAASSVQNRFKLFRSVSDAEFIESAVFEDAAQGLYKLDMLQKNAQVLVDIHFELRLMFGITIAYAVVVFYFFAFKRTVSDLISEAVESRIFLRTIPMEKVPKSQSAKLFELFFSSGYEEM